MDQSTLIELGILAVLVYVVTHPTAPVVNITNVPPTQSASGGTVNDIINGVVSFASHLL